MDQKIIIYTDGSARGNPGLGGFGAIVATPYKVFELGGYSSMTTNNRMELMAAYEALKTLELARVDKPSVGEVIVYSDSTYVVKGITTWIHSWMKNGWKTSTKEPVEHRDLWEGLYDISKKWAPKWVVLKGHSGIPANERCDAIATGYADGMSVGLYVGSREGYSVNLDPKSPGGSAGKEKSASKKKSSMKQAYSYVSKVGDKISVTKTWVECEKLVKGKSGAKFKKVFSKDEEKSLMDEWAV